QMRYLSLECSGSTPRPPTNRTCLVGLQWKAPRKHPKQVPEPPQLIMDQRNSLEPSDSQSQSTVPLSPIHVPPTLRDGECYHVFISYSSTDHQWTHSIINQLESYGLQVCYHDRDFTPGRTVLENMSECIQESQKVLLVLSPEFVRSRWCLLEANMSLFRDCLERKPIVPVLLQPGVSVPPHLCHLTYLEATDPEFMNKLILVRYLQSMS
uniref:TIR domain-containing protein n=1 Tax=Seriola lalandi dorsalis TaxID=1841481 RepID=A0A3B4WB42_SERLL